GIVTIIGFYLIRLAVDAEAPSGQAVGEATNGYAMKNFVGIYVFINMVETQHHVCRSSIARWHSDADNARAVVAQGDLHAPLVIQHDKMLFRLTEHAPVVGF